MDHHPLILIAALVADRFFGDPAWLWQRLTHPVVWMGNLVGWADRRFNLESLKPDRRRQRGLVVTAVLMVLMLVFGLLLAGMFRAVGPLGLLLEIVVVTAFLAQKSLADHVAAVASGLRSDGVEGGRRAVAHIVGRNPKMLDRAGVTRAAIESLAENASDGVVAPAFWYAVLGLPGLLVYKLVNTADSMIGNHSPRHVDFGRAAALTDDVLNWLPARLTGFMTVVAAWSLWGRAVARQSLDVMARDARLHRSPNCGWPEAAFAGVLGVALAGPRDYGSYRVSEPMVHAAGRRDADAPDIDAAILLFWRLCAALTVLAVFLLLV